MLNGVWVNVHGRFQFGSTVLLLYQWTPGEHKGEGAVGLPKARIAVVKVPAASHTARMS